MSHVPFAALWIFRLRILGSKRKPQSDKETIPVGILLPAVENHLIPNLLRHTASSFITTQQSGAGLSLKKIKFLERSLFLHNL